MKHSQGVYVSKGYRPVDLRSRSCARIFFDSVNPNRFMQSVSGEKVRLATEDVVFYVVNCRLGGRTDGFGENGRGSLLNYRRQLVRRVDAGFTIIINHLDSDGSRLILSAGSSGSVQFGRSEREAS